MMRTRVLLAEDETLVREGLAQLLKDEFQVVASTGDAQSMRQEARRRAPDVVVASLTLLVRGVAALRSLREDSPELRIVVVGPDSPELAGQAFAAGVSGWVLRSSTAEELRAAVRAAGAGRRYLTPRMSGGDIRALPPAPGSAQVPLALTPRALEVLRLLAQGKAMKQAAADLGITVRTVAFHKYRTMRVLGIDSSAGLVRYAVRHNMV